MNKNAFNASFAYSKGGVRNQFSLRVNGVSHGYDMIAEESSGRNRKAFYPHSPAVSDFAITAQLIGQSEWYAFNLWLTGYIEFMLGQDINNNAFPQMTVIVVSKNFWRQGIPKTGIGFGDHVGAMVWEPTIVFESAMDPLDATKYATPSAFTDQAANGYDVNIRYFYPMSPYIEGTPPPNAYDPILEPTQNSPAPTTAALTPQQSQSVIRTITGFANSIDTALQGVF